MLKYKTAVVICSVFRPLQLKHVVESVPPEYRVVVMCWDKAVDTVAMDREVEVYEMPGASICERSWFASGLLKDYNILGLCDDTLVFYDTIRKGEEQMERDFGNTDCVCGIQAFKEGYIELHYAFCIYGKEWIDRFKDRKFYYPWYKRFYVDKEWWVTAMYLKKWTFCFDAWIYHMPDLNDKTHYLGDRDKITDEDEAEYLRRRKEGLIWGVTDGQA